jgi:hypothetical protein
MPKFKRGSGWVKKKEWRPVSDNAVGRPKTRPAKPKATPIAQLIPQLWQPTYWPLMEQLLEQQPELAQLVTAYVNSNRSSYSKSRQKDNEALAAYLQRERYKIVGIVQTIMSTGHQVRGAGILKLLKSIVSMKQRLERKRWDQDVKAGLIYSFKSTMKYVEALTACQPEPDIVEPTPYIVSICADQFHVYRGCRKGEYHRSVERTDEDGNKIKVLALTVMNLHEYPVDNDTLGMTQEEVVDIRNNGVYTEPASLVYDELDYDKSKEALCEFWAEDCDLLFEMAGENADAIDSMDFDSLLQLVLSLAARPQHHSPKTPVRMHQPRCDCDTNNYDDIQTFWTWILQKFPDAVAIICDLDGQGIGMMANAKNIRAERFAPCVPKPADMHGEAHVGVYCGCELYHEALLKPISDALGFKKIEKKVMNLDKDRFDNHKYFTIGLGLACKMVLIRKFGMEMVAEVKRMEAFLDVNLGYKLLYFYKLQAGGVALMWQRAQRSNRSHRLNQCWAYGFHLCRAAHKTNYQIYGVMRAHTIRCTHPRIRLQLHMNASVNETGRVGVMQGKDRKIEYMHAVVTEYIQDTKHSFEDCLFVTEHYTSLDHVNNTFNEALGLDDSTPMEVKTGFRHTVQSMVVWMEERLELFKDKPNFNPFTGLDMEVGDMRVKQPWMFVDQIAAGNCGPIGYPFSKKNWKQVVKHLLRKDMYQTIPEGEDSDSDEEIGGWNWLDDHIDE